MGGRERRTWNRDQGPGNRKLPCEKKRRQEDRLLPPPVLAATAFALCLKLVLQKPFYYSNSDGGAEGSAVPEPDGGGC